MNWKQKNLAGNSKKVKMKNLNEAHSIIKSVSYSWQTTEKSLTEALGFILAEDIYSDMDMPPFDKSAVDGYACMKNDLENPLRVIEFVAAGKLPQKQIAKNTCIKIMTGAKVPEGADCIITAS